MKISAQLITHVIATSIQAQKNSDPINFINSQISIADAGLPTAQVQSVISFVDGQISQALTSGIPIIIGIGNNGGSAFASGSNIHPTPTDGFRDFGSASTGTSSASTSTNTSNTSSDSKIVSPSKYTYLVSGIAFTIIGNHLF